MATLTVTLPPTTTAADLAAQVVRALGYPATVSEVPVGTRFYECDYSSAHDHLDDRPASCTIYGTETTLDVCRACLQRALDPVDGFHVDTGNDPLRTKVDIFVLAAPRSMADTSWTEPIRLASVVDRDGREGYVTAHEDLFTGSHRVTVGGKGPLEFDPSTPHGRAALAALRDAIDTALGGAA
jgi:hypothetical protein